MLACFDVSQQQARVLFLTLHLTLGEKAPAASEWHHSLMCDADVRSCRTSPSLLSGPPPAASTHSRPTYRPRLHGWLVSCSDLLPTCVPPAHCCVSPLGNYKANVYRHYYRSAQRLIAVSLPGRHQPITYCACTQSITCCAHPHSAAMALRWCPDTTTNKAAMLPHS